jgi:hypothetical protein
LVINANLLMGNSADSGTGGGLRFQAVNGTDIARFPNPTTGLARGANCSSQATCNWYVVSVTNNIISDNVAGWDGAGVSLEDSLVVNFVNNTVASNDSTASSGVLFNTLGAPNSSSQSPPTQTSNGSSSLPQPAGFVSLHNSPQLISSFTTGTITCPTGHFTGSANNGTCTKVSYPLMFNNVFWQNRSFYIGVGSLGAGTLNQQNVVTLFPTLSQATTGQCVSGLSSTWTTGGGYWDLGVRGDTGPANHGSGFTLNPTNSVLTNTSGYSGTNFNGNPQFVSQYCNGSRVPPEATCKSVTGQTIACGYQAPPGISDATVPNPIFSLTPSATVDEGNNWINLSWGPLALTDPVHNLLLGNYAPNTGSSAIDHGLTSSSNVAAPTTDFFGNNRIAPYDIGAIEVSGSGGGGGASASLTPASRDFGTHARTCPGNTFSQIVVCLLEPTQTFTLTNTGNVTITGIGAATIGGTDPTEFAIVALGTTCGTSRTTLAPGAACTILVQFKPQLNLPAGAKSATVSVTDSAGTQTSNLTGNATP